MSSLTSPSYNDSHGLIPTDSEEIEDANWCYCSVAKYCPAPLSTISWSLLRFKSIELVMLSNHCYILSPCSLCDPFFFFLVSVWLLFINHQNIWPIYLISRCFGLIYIANFFFFTEHIDFLGKYSLSESA